MNNTQQAGETAREFLRRKNILGKDCKYFIIDFSDGREVSLTDLLIEYAAYLPTSAPDAVEAVSAGVWVKASERLPGYDEKEGWRKEYHCEYETQDWHADKSGETWTLMKTSFKSNILKHLLNSGRNVKWLDESLAGHAEGQKATVEAKSAGVWVNAGSRPPANVNGHGLILRRADDKGAFKSAIDGIDGDWVFRWSPLGSKINVIALSRIEWLDETTTSHAEGEKGAMLFGDWLRKQRPDVFYGNPTTGQLYNTYLKDLTC